LLRERDTALPGALWRDRPPGRMPGAGASGRGGAQRRRLDPIRLNSAVERTSTDLDHFLAERTASLRNGIIPVICDIDCTHLRD
jgi:hypothetical protein